MTELVSTGIERLDEALIDEKGIAVGSSVLIEGTSGSGKELLSKQFASAGIGSENVVYFSTDETSDELIETFEQYRWPTDLRIVNVGTQYFEKVLSRELQASRFKQEGLSVSELRNLGSYGSTADQINFVADMTYEVSKLRAPFRVVIDSLDFFFQYYNSPPKKAKSTSPLRVTLRNKSIKSIAPCACGTSTVFDKYILA